MTIRSFGWLDFNDPARQGGHTVAYTNGEVEDYLEMNLVAYRAGVEWKAETVGAILGLTMAEATSTQAAHVCFVGTGLLPEKYVLDSLTRWVSSGSFQPVMSGAIALANNSEYPGYNITSGWDNSDQPHKNAVCFSNSGGVAYPELYIKNPSTGLIEAQENAPTPMSTGIYYRFITKKTGDAYFNFVYDETGSHFWTFTSFPLANVYEADEADKLLVGYGILSTSYTKLHSKYLMANPFDDEDWLQETETGVGSTGTLQGGAATFKDALTDGLATTYIDLAPGQTITLSTPSAAVEDRPVFGLQINADCSDANPLDVEFSTAGAPSVWTSALQIGSTRGYRNSVTNISPWTNGMNHILYPEIAKGLGLAINATVGFRFTRITNNTGSTIAVRQAWLWKSLQDITMVDTSAELLIDYTVPTGDAPIGSTGTTQTLGVKNSSDQTWTSIRVLLIDDGYTAGDIIQYSADTITWYDEGSPPAHADGMLLAGGTFTPGSSGTWYVRTNIPASGDVLQSFRAKFKITTEV